MTLEIVKQFEEKTDTESKMKVEFAFEQAEQRLISTIEFSNTIESKATQLISYFIAVFLIKQRL